MSDSSERGSDSGLTRILESAKNQLEQMIDLHPQGMLLLDESRHVARCNDSLLQILGFETFADVLGKTIPELFSGCPEEDDSLFDETDPSRRVHVRYPCDIQGKGERLLDVTRISAGDMNAPAVLLVEDVTEKIRQHEEENRKTQIRAAQAVTGALMHELNQPLTVITVQAHVLIHDLERGNVDVDHLKGALEEIVELTQGVADRLNSAQSFRKFVTKPYIEGQEILDIDKSTG